MGLVSVLSYPKLRTYQETLERDVNALLKEHKAVAMQVVKKSVE